MHLYDRHLPPPVPSMAGQAPSLRPVLQQIVTAGPRPSRLVSSPLVRATPLTAHDISPIQESFFPNDSLISTNTVPPIAAAPSLLTKTHRRTGSLLRQTLTPLSVCGSPRPVPPVDIPPAPRTPTSPILAALSELEEPRSAWPHIEVQRAAMVCLQSHPILISRFSLTLVFFIQGGGCEQDSTSSDRPPTCPYRRRARSLLGIIWGGVALLVIWQDCGGIRKSCGQKDTFATRGWCVKSKAAQGRLFWVQFRQRIANDCWPYTAPSSRSSFLVWTRPSQHHTFHRLHLRWSLSEDVIKMARGREYERIHETVPCECFTSGTYVAPRLPINHD